MTDNPFLGARPYGPADDDVFFGRDTATAMLAERIALRPLTILTAPSGIGKTSILRAAVLPTLERDGLCTAYLRVDPDESGDCAAALLGPQLVTAMAQALLPDVDAELRCLRTVRANAPVVATLGDARAWFEALPSRHEVRKELLGSFEGPVDRLPLLSRVLRGTLDPEAFGEQLARLGATLPGTTSGDTQLDLLGSALGDPRFADGVAAARKELTGLGEADLGGAVRRLTGTEGGSLLVRPDGDPDLSVRIVLVLDQFEQVFTSASPASRAAALARLGALLPENLPVHLVLTLRKEWYADLVQHMPRVSRAAETADRTTYHLLPMTRSEAEEVMTRAPTRIGATPIPPPQRALLWDGLQSDDGIDAVTLSVACHELFAANRLGAEGVASCGVGDLLRMYLERALQQIADPADHDEALDMLGEIAGTEATTRSFVTHSHLRNAPLRDPVRRDHILTELQRAFLVKGDSPRRGFDKVYDVMHERLLEPLRRHLSGHPHVAAFRDAAQRLAEADGKDLDWQRCCALVQGRRRLHLDARSAAILLRSLLCELTRDRREGISMHREPLSQHLDDHDGDPLQGLRHFLGEQARTAVSPWPAITAATSLGNAPRWLTPAEIEHRTREAADRDFDAHAMVSALRGPAGKFRREVSLLATRLACAPARTAPTVRH